MHEHDEMRAADEAVVEAIQQWRESRGYRQDGDVVIEFVFGAFVQNIDTVDEFDSYTAGFRLGMPPHHVSGLFDSASDIAMVLFDDD